VRDLGEEVARKESRDAQEFTLALARELHERFPRLVRRRGSPQDAVATLERGEASCADLAVLYMAVARSQGFAARFVSGYSAVPDVNDDHDVYAWAELYIPGVAWRGFDPSTAQATGDRHVAIAAGALAEQAAPVSGTYAGRATSTLDSNVAITEVSASA
jgi:transglutaminase-like putative cysteine protease